MHYLSLKTVSRPCTFPIVSWDDTALLVAAKASAKAHLHNTMVCQLTDENTQHYKWEKNPPVIETKQLNNQSLRSLLQSRVVSCFLPEDGDCCNRITEMETVLKGSYSQSFCELGQGVWQLLSHPKTIIKSNVATSPPFSLHIKPVWVSLPPLWGFIFQTIYSLLLFTFKLPPVICVFSDMWYSELNTAFCVLPLLVNH